MNRDHNNPDLNEEQDQEETPERVYVVRPNKSALKREHHKVQKLAEDLIQLPESKLLKLIDNEAIIKHLLLGKRLKAGAYRRHIKFLANQLLSLDEEVLMGLLEDDKDKEKKLNQHFHRLENIRDRLINEGNEALNELLSQYPQLDRQQLRNLIRQAVKEQENKSPPKSSRMIFKLLRDNIE